MQLPLPLHEKHRGVGEKSAKEEAIAMEEAKKKKGKKNEA